MLSRRLGPVCLALLLGVAAVWAQELPASPQPQPNAGQKQTGSTASPTSSSKPAADPQPPSATDNQPPPTTEKKQPSKLKRVLNRAKPNCAHVEGTETCWDKDARTKE